MGYVLLGEFLLNFLPARMKTGVATILFLLTGDISFMIKAEKFLLRIVLFME